MKAISSFTVLLAFLALAFAAPGAALSGLSTRSGDDLPYPVVPMQFSGILAGREVKLTGTIQEVFNHMRTIDPTFDHAHPIANSTLADTSLESRAELAARNQVFPPLCCPIPGQNWGYARRDVIAEGVRYLTNLDGGHALCGVPARRCVPVSCSYNSAIYLCNDNDYGITPSCLYIATYAAAINNPSICHGRDACGQMFDTDRYNVVVRGDHC